MRVTTSLSIIVLILISVSCNDKKKSSGQSIKFSIVVKKPIKDAVIKLEEIKDNRYVTYKSFDLGTGNARTISLELKEPKLVRLNIYGKQYVDVVLNDTDVKVVVAGESGGSAKVTGSKDTEYFNTISTTIQGQHHRINALQERYITSNLEERSSIEREFETTMNENSQELKSKIESFGNSIVALIAAEEFLDPDHDFVFFDKLSKKFAAELPHSKYTKAFVKMVDGKRKLAIGAKAPEISLPSPEGDMVSLSSFKGSYVLIDFWAAWCKPCRQENPNVVRLYKKYHQKGFEILGVSLDRTKDAWLSAIEQDGLVWNHVSDLKYFRSKAAEDYQIQAIPATYLVGPEGKIIAKNLRGAQLQRKLAEIFGGGDA